jgi:hypothetical protein
LVLVLDVDRDVRVDPLQRPQGTSRPRGARERAIELVCEGAAEISRALGHDALRAA